MKCMFSTLLATTVVLVAPARAGDLNPPAGPVAPTMKTLDQIEPRIDVNSLPGNANAVHIISEAGSYYLTSDIQAGINQFGIQVSAPGDVSIDLNGFAINGVAGSFDGIGVTTPSFRGLTVCHGSIRGFVRAIDAQASSFVGVIQDVAMSSCTGEGIVAGGEYLIERCIIRECDLQGLLLGNRCSIRHCSFFAIDGSAIEALTNTRVSDCLAQFCGAPAITLGDGSRIDACTLESGPGDGLVVGNSATVMNCSAEGFTGIGIRAGSRCVITGCIVDTNGSDGIRAFDASSIENCAAFTNGNHGIKAGSVTSIRGCVAAGNTVDGINVNGRCRIESCTSDGNINHGFAGGDSVTLSGCEAAFNTVDGFHFTGAISAESCVATSNENAGFIADGEGAFLGCLAIGNMAGSGFFSGTRLLASGCTARGNGGTGFLGNPLVHVVGCQAILNQGDGIVMGNGQVLSSTSLQNSGLGILALSGGMASDCLVGENMAGGIIAQSVRGCYVHNNTGTGITGAYVEACDVAANTAAGIFINADDGGYALRNNCVLNGGNGVTVRFTVRGRIEGNTCVANDVGIESFSNLAVIVKNSCSANTMANYALLAGPGVAPIGAPNLSTNPWINIEN